MKLLARLLCLLTAAAAISPAPARAESCEADQSCLFHLSNSWSATRSDYAFTLGTAMDEPLVGDWNGDGTDTVGVRSGRSITLSNSSRGGADVRFSFGTETDTILVGAWGGTADTLAVRRGNQYLLTTTLGGPVTQTIHYGKDTDEVYIGDWNGDGRDSFAVRRGNTFYLSNTLASGRAETVFRYGRAGDEVLVGDWNGDGKDTFAVRRGNTWFMSNSLKGGNAETVLTYGRAGDTALIGDWDGNKIDTPGIFRGTKPARPTTNGGLTSTTQPHRGRGTFAVSSLNTTPARNASRVVRVRIETEHGLNVNTDEFARSALAILNDKRGWGGNGSLTFVSTTGAHDVRLRLTSPATVDRLCAPLDTRGYTSCRVGTNVVINVNRWASGATPFMNAGGTIAEYRAYVINHEMGHYLGRGHLACPGRGRLAPVMQQQTLFMNGCRPNGWPNP